MRHHSESMRKAAELNSDCAVGCRKENTACAAIRGSHSDVYTAYYGDASFTPKRTREYRRTESVLLEKRVAKKNERNQTNGVLETKFSFTKKTTS